MVSYSLRSFSKSLDISIFLLVLIWWNFHWLLSSQLIGSLSKSLDVLVFMLVLMWRSLVWVLSNLYHFICIFGGIGFVIFDSLFKKKLALHMYWIDTSSNIIKTSRGCKHDNVTYMLCMLIGIPLDDCFKFVIKCLSLSSKIYKTKRKGKC